MVMSLISRCPAVPGASIPEACILNSALRAAGFLSKTRIWLFRFVLLARLASVAWAADDAIQSKWDKQLLAVRLGDVRIQAGNMADAWEEVATKYLLRANLYMDVAANSTNADRTPFAFHKEKATGKDLLDALLSTYSSFTYTQSPETGIMWIYPKRVNYGYILNQKVRIDHHASQVPMYTGVYIPLCKLLAPNVVDSVGAVLPMDMPIDPATGKPPLPAAWLYDVDLPAGVYSAREILDFCCVANPNKAFLVRPLRGQQSHLVISLTGLLYGNPLAPPRVEAIKFWEIEIGIPTNETPSREEVRAALSDPNPEKRLAASLYLEATHENYTPADLIGHADGSEQAIWTVLGVGYARLEARTRA